MKHVGKTLANERGVAVPMMAVSMMVLLFCAGVGIDVGRLGVVADEVQNAADIAATAAAVQFIDPAAGDTATPRDSAESVLSQNEISNTTVSGSHLTDLAFGFYNVADNSFTANLAPTNAVRSRVEYLTQNLVFGLLGKPDSLVTKVAVAAFSPTGAGEPTIPIAVGECLFAGCTEEDCQPTLTQAPNASDNSAWTGYSSTASTSHIANFFPSECGGDDPSNVPTIKVGDTINLINGQATPLLREIQCMIDNDLLDVKLPVVPCGGAMNQGQPVIGFAHFTLISVRTTGSNKGITMRGTMDANDGPGGGIANFGSGVVTLVH